MKRILLFLTLFLSLGFANHASAALSSEADDLAPTLAEVTRDAIQVQAQHAAHLVAQAAEEARRATYSMARRMLETVWTHCTKENFNKFVNDYGRTTAQAASVIAALWASYKQLKALMPAKDLTCAIPQGELKKWGGNFPKPIEDLVELQQCAEAFAQRGAPPLHNGYLLHGVPGTGKTFLAKALAEKLQIPLIEVNSGQFLSALQGSGNARLAEILKLAHKCKKGPGFKCIVFIDEIDGLSRSRGYGEEDRLFNDLLTTITTRENQDILFLAATNFIDRMDSALTRDGRLTPVELKLPDQQARQAILENFLKVHKLQLDEKRIFISKTQPSEKPSDGSDGIPENKEFVVHPAVTSEEFVKQTEGMSSATIEQILNTAFQSQVMFELFKTAKIKKHHASAVVRWLYKLDQSRDVYAPSFTKALKRALDDKKKAMKESADLPENVKMMYC